MRATHMALIVLCACDAQADPPLTQPPDTGCAVDPVAVYDDADGDAYGDDATGAFVCEPAPEQVLVGGDCDDLDPAVHPGAEDAWYDGVDADCEGDDDFDADGDGHATEPEGGDCADDDPTVFPGAAADAACDGVDGDCDGVAPRCEVPFSALAGSYTGDGLDGAVAFAGDMDGDGHDDILVGSRFSYSGEGAAYLLSGPVTGSHVLPGVGIEIRDDTAEGDMLGVALAPAGDWDGDGDDDLWVGAGDYGYVLPGPIGSPTTSLDLSTSIASLFPTGHVNGRMLGGRDVTGDGQPDVLTNALGAGLFLFAGTWTGHRDVADVDLTIDHANWLCRYTFGEFHDWAGDTDGDGVEEIYAGTSCGLQGTAPGGVLVPGTERGTVWVGLGAAFTTFPPHVAGTGGFDVDDDGYDDMAIALYNQGSNGMSTLHVLHGPFSTGEVDPGASSTTSLYASLDSVVASPGDLDQDGRDDLAFGLYLDRSVGLVLGSQEGALVDEDIEIVLRNDPAFDGRATEFAIGGDADGDAVPDLLIGKSGGAWLVLGTDLPFTQ